MYTHTITWQDIKHTQTDRRMHTLTAPLLNSWQQLNSLSRVRLVNWSLQHTNTCKRTHIHTLTQPDSLTHAEYVEKVQHDEGLERALNTGCSSNFDILVSTPSLPENYDINPVLNWHLTEVKTLWTKWVNGSWVETVLYHLRARILQSSSACCCILKQLNVFF